jgi:hypothetical protein
MTGLLPTQTPPILAGDWRVWQEDRRRVEQEIVEGHRFQVWDTERGRYDGMLDFMLRLGLWAEPPGYARRN